MQKVPPIKLIDLSQPIYDACPRCPEDPPVRSEFLSRHDRDGWQVELLTLTSHAGSHLDVPRHRFPGAPAIDDFSLDRFVGPAILLDYRSCRAGQPFTSSMMNRTLRHVADLSDKIILIGTGWGEKRGKSNEWEGPLPFLSPDGAEWLVEQEIRGVGIDTYSIGGSVPRSNELTHEALLQANIWIAEDLRFPEETFGLPQPLEFWALPIHLQKHGGAFCRPVLVQRI